MRGRLRFRLVNAWPSLSISVSGGGGEDDSPESCGEDEGFSDAVRDGCEPYVRCTREDMDVKGKET